MKKVLCLVCLGAVLFSVFGGVSAASWTYGMNCSGSGYKYSFPWNHYCVAKINYDRGQCVPDSYRLEANVYWDRLVEGQDTGWKSCTHWGASEKSKSVETDNYSVWSVAWGEYRVRGKSLLIGDTSISSYDTRYVEG